MDRGVKAKAGRHGLPRSSDEAGCISKTVFLACSSQSGFAKSIAKPLIVKCSPWRMPNSLNFKMATQAQEW